MFRIFLLVAFATGLSEAKNIKNTEISNKTFPEGFWFGCGTAAYQIEGAWNEDGKGESDWDRYTHDNPKQFPENADIACDSYHKWREDVEHIKNLGLKFYRFSISWSRILPNGTINHINQKGIDYYLNLIKELKANGIEPLVTIFHWDIPQYISELGGFLNSEIVDYYADFARLAFKNFGPFVKYWFTFNEPTIFCLMGYQLLSAPPGYDLNGVGTYQCGHNLLKAHAKAYHIYQNEFKAFQKGYVGIVLETSWYKPKNRSDPLDVEASNRAMNFNLGWFAHPIFKGNYPQVMIDRIANRSLLAGYSKSRLPTFTTEEIESLKGTADLFALNSYYWFSVSYQDELPLSAINSEGDLGANSTFELNNGTLKLENIRNILDWIQKEYNPKAILITENGLGDQGGLQDDDRIDYVQTYLNEILKAIYEDKINVIGYSIWSLMDNYEWGTYEKKFGIIRVDFTSPNRTRTWKKSAYWYKKVAATRCLVEQCE